MKTECRYGHANCKKRCTKKSKGTGVQCVEHEWPEAPGSGQCRWHGGKSPQVIAAARERLIDHLEEVTGVHLRIALGLVEGAKPSDMVAAINSLYDRVGLPKQSEQRIDLGSAIQDVDGLVEAFRSAPEVLVEAMERLAAEGDDGG